MAELKHATDIPESQPPSLSAVRELFNEFNISDVSDEICTRILDVLYRHTCEVVEEAKAISLHSNRSKIEEDDLKLAISSITDGLSFAPPYKEQLLAYAERNEQPLPPIRPYCGIRLPADRFNLTAPNYSLHQNNTELDHQPELPSISTNLHSPYVGTTAPNVFRLSAAPSANSNRSVSSTINSSSVHVIAPPGVGPSMIRVQSVQSVPQLSSVDNTPNVITFPIGSTIANNIFPIN